MCLCGSLFKLPFSQGVISEDIIPTYLFGGVGSLFRQFYLQCIETCKKFKQLKYDFFVKKKVGVNLRKNLKSKYQEYNWIK